MTTPTTNYGWLKPDPSEASSITVIDTLLDAMDTSIKSVSDTLTSKIYTMAQYRIKRKMSVTGNGVVFHMNSSSPDLWEEEWSADGNTGTWTFPATGVLQFTEAAIYKINYQFTMFALGQSVTSGTVSIGLYEKDTTNLVTRSKTYHRSNTIDNFQRTTLQGSYYIWAGPGSDQCLLNTEYDFGLQQKYAGGFANLLFNPVDILPFRSELTIECVRPL